MTMAMENIGHTSISQYSQQTPYSAPHGRAMGVYCEYWNEIGAVMTKIGRRNYSDRVDILTDICISQQAPNSS